MTWLVAARRALSRWRRSNAVGTLDAFPGWLRDGIDIAAVQQERIAVQQTVPPAHASVPAAPMTARQAAKVFATASALRCASALQLLRLGIPASIGDGGRPSGVSE